MSIITGQNLWIVFTEWINFFSKVYFHTPIQANTCYTKVSRLMNGAERIFVVLCLLVISLQNPVKDILDILTMLMKSCPISSPAQVILDRKNIDLSCHCTQDNMNFLSTFLNTHHMSQVPKVY